MTKEPYLIQFAEFTENMDKPLVKTKEITAFKAKEYTIVPFYKEISRLI